MGESMRNYALEIGNKASLAEEDREVWVNR